MGTTIDRRAYRQLSCSKPQGLFVLQDQKLLPAGVPHLNVGLALSERLKDIKQDQRGERVENELLALINDGCKELILERADILFDASWHMDVLRLLLKAGRNRKIYIVWPGNVLGCTLQYAEPTMKGYALYDVSKYVDTYIVSK